MKSKHIRIEGSDEVFYASRVGGMIGTGVGAAFVTIGIFLIGEAPWFFLLFWIGFSGFAMVASGLSLLKRQVFLRIKPEGLLFPLTHLPLLRWEDIDSVVLGPKIKRHGSKTYHTTEAGRPIRIRLRNADSYREGLGKLWAMQIPKPGADGISEIEVDGSLSPVPTVEVIRRITFYAGPQIEGDRTVIEREEKRAKNVTTGALLFITFWGLGFGGGGSFFAFIGFRDMARAQMAEGWPIVPGIVQSASVSVSRDSDSTTYGVDMSYTYSVNGIDHIGTQYAFGEFKTGNRSRAERIVAENPPGTQVKVRFNPDDHTQAVLKAGISWHHFIPAGMGSLFALIGFGVMAGVYRSYFKQRRENAGQAVGRTA
jgi:hypothetical protein